jgi:hypothetical protein
MNLRASVLVAAVLAAGCGAPKIEPEIQSSVDEAAYAVDYPAVLLATASGFANRETEAKSIRESWGKLKTDLAGVESSKLAEIVQKADRAGKSRAYAERRKEIDGTNDFYAESREVLTKKPANAAQYVVKQKGCDADVGGVVTKSIEESFGKAAEKRLRDQNEAFVLVEQLRDRVPKEKVALLEQRADEIALASYIVHVDLVERKLRLRRMLGEAEAVKKTLERAAEDERNVQKDGKRSAGDRKASEERGQKIRLAAGNVESAQSQARELEKAIEKRIEEASKAHDQAVADLVKALGG